MVLGFAFSLFNKVATGQICDDDTADRLSYRITTTILIVSSILISTKQLVGEPISCWIPAHFTGNHEEYTNNYCWVRNTYYLPWDENIPKEHEANKRYMITYYQWIPLILLIQALFFYLPRMVWATLSKRVGVDLPALMGEAKKLQDSMEYEEHENVLTNMSYHMHRMFKRGTGNHEMTVSLKSMMSRACCYCAGRSKGNYLILIFLLTKVLYLANVLSQMFILNYVLGFRFDRYGWEVLERLANQEEYVETPFPRVTMCDMKVRRLGNVHRYAVQCVLPINLFTEKLYLFQWFWYLLLAVMSGMEIIQWFWRISVMVSQRRKYIDKHLKLAKENFDDDDEMVLSDVDAFVDRYLKQDGVFIMRLIAKNTTQAVATMVTKRLWKQFEPWWEEHQKDQYDNKTTLPIRKKEKPKIVTPKKGKYAL